MIIIISILHISTFKEITGLLRERKWYTYMYLSLDLPYKNWSRLPFAMYSRTRRSSEDLLQQPNRRMRFRWWTLLISLTSLSNSAFALLEDIAILFTATTFPFFSIPCSIKIYHHHFVCTMDSQLHKQYIKGYHHQLLVKWQVQRMYTNLIKPKRPKPIVFFF